jgi:magnesium chelatase family protein
MAARRLPSVLPPLTPAEMLELTSLYSVAGLLTPEVGAITTRPFRVPHQTVSSAGLIGGGDPARPGEVSLAHLGVLFLDELPEHRRTNLDALAGVLVEEEATISRARQRVSFPAKPLVVGAMLPCPCGLAGSTSSGCFCSPEKIATYWDRMTGPLFERFDLRITVPAVEVAHLQAGPKGATSGTVQARVATARDRQLERSTKLNARLSPKELTVASVDLAGMSLSAAEQHRVRRVARTIADLDASDAIRTSHAAEALQLAVRSRT